MQGVVASGIAFAVQIWCIDRGGPVFVAVYQPVQTLVVAIMASVALGEEFYLGGYVFSFHFVGPFHQSGIVIVIKGTPTIWTPNRSINCIVDCDVQDHWGGADHSGIVPGAVGQKRRKEVCSRKGRDSVCTGAQQHQNTHHPHQDLPHSATPSFLHRKCLTHYYPDLFHFNYSFTLQTEGHHPKKKKEYYYPTLYQNLSLCVYEILFSFVLSFPNLLY